MKRGTSLIELLIYLAILAATTVLVVFTMVQFGDVYRKARFDRKIAVAGEVAMERIVREIRLACDINNPFTPTSVSLKTFASHSSASEDCATATSNKSLEFSGGRLTFDGSDLVPSDVTVSRVEFAQIPSVTSKSIHVFLELTVSSSKKSFVVSAALRGSY